MKAKICALILTLLVATAFVASSISHDIPTSGQTIESFVADGGGNGGSGIPGRDDEI